MAGIRAVYQSIIRCLNERRWEDLRGYIIHSGFTANGREHTPESYAAEMKTAGDAEITLDIVTVDQQSRRLAATVLVKWRPLRPVMGFEPSGKTVHFAEQRFNWFTDDGKLSKTIVLADREAILRQLSGTPSTTSQAPEVVGKQGGGSAVDTLVTLGTQDPVPNDNDGRGLEEMYRTYLDCINRRTMETDLSTFCHPRVFHNGIELSLDKYRRLMQDAITAIPDINFGLHTLVADADIQRVAARLEFTGTPVKAIEGVDPTGQPVHFAEHVTYQLREGKIDSVWSIVDWVSYREQLSR